MFARECWQADEMRPGEESWAEGGLRSSSTRLRRGKGEEEEEEGEGEEREEE